MGYRDSQNPHLKYDNLKAIRDNLWKHCRVTDGSMPADIIHCVTDILPQKGWSMTDSQLVLLANDIVDIYMKNTRNPYSPSLLGVIFNGLLKRATFDPSTTDQGLGEASNAVITGKAEAEQAFHRLIRAIKRNPRTGCYDLKPVVSPSLATGKY